MKVDQATATNSATGCCFFALVPGSRFCFPTPSLRFQMDLVQAWKVNDVRRPSASH